MMSQPSAGRLYQVRGKWLDLLRTLAVAIAVNVILFVAIFRTDAERRQYPTWFVVGMVVLSVFAIYRSLTLPIAIETRDDGTIRFQSFLRSESISVSELEYVKRGTLQLRLLTFAHTRGKVRTRRSFHDFHDFLSWVRQANPRVEIIGF